MGWCEMLDPPSAGIPPCLRHCWSLCFSVNGSCFIARRTCDPQGAGPLAWLVGEAGQSMRIVAAGNVTHENIAEIVRRTGVVEVHSSARR
jgi:hypothetical protein